MPKRRGGGHRLGASDGKVALALTEDFGLGAVLSQNLVDMGRKNLYTKIVTNTC